MDTIMDTAAQERILSSLRAKGYNFDDYRELYEYVDKLDLQTYHPVDFYDLPPEARDFLNEDEVGEVLNDVYAQRYPESAKKTTVVDSEALEDHYVI